METSLPREIRKHIRKKLHALFLDFLYPRACLSLTNVAHTHTHIATLSTGNLEFPLDSLFLSFRAPRLFVLFTRSFFSPSRASLAALVCYFAVVFHPLLFFSSLCLVAFSRERFFAPPPRVSVAAVFYFSFSRALSLAKRRAEQKCASIDSASLP